MSRINNRTGTAVGPKRTAETAPEPSVKSPASQSAVASREEIARLAYQLWDERGRPEGSPDADWFRAEKQLLDLRSESA
jgi:hypothetical protein